MTGTLHPWSTYSSDRYCQRPHRPQGVPWYNGLKAAIDDPSQVIDSDSTTVVLLDGFPKARHHYLIVPKQVNINSIGDVTTDHLPLLEHMHARSKELVKKINVNEEATFHMGYHAIPSMKLLHLHVISDDFDSQKMRTVHHWNTFNTDFFIDSHTAVEMVKKHGRVEVDEKHYNDILHSSPRCNICSKHYQPSEFNQLREHRRTHDTKTYFETINFLH